ncbi:hypothetical protein R1flu_018652 [Riccia fluitans]|uniref:Inositol polyphosphate 5-phosphatase n=1 Tax=Riccia fluitans TaxID=41844 RepID=A0ABD1ZKE0_9MARC
MPGGFGWEPPEANPFGGQAAWSFYRDLSAIRRSLEFELDFIRQLWSVVPSVRVFPADCSQLFLLGDLNYTFYLSNQHFRRAGQKTVSSVNEERLSNAMWA